MQRVGVRVATTLLALATVAAGALVVTNDDGTGPLTDIAGESSATTTGPDGRASGEDPTTTAAPTTASTTTTLVPHDGKRSDERSLTKATVITGGLTPKSIVSDGRGRMFAQNMVYSHTVNVYDRTYQRVAQIPDSVDLTAFGKPGMHQGGPVEAALSADREHMYVTNYQMYGSGFSNPGHDECPKSATWDPSYVYRVALDSLEIDQIIQVGPVPKYIATSPDGKWVFNSNWCSDDLSVIDAASGAETRRVPLGRYPRGIAVTPDSGTAYVAVMGSSDIAVINLTDFSVGWIRNVGRGPRHLVIDSAGTFLYATLNSVGQVAKIDVATNTVVAKVASPSQPRSMTISPDGSALYVVNYASDAISKIRTSDMVQTQRLAVNHHPIGIDYDAGTHQVWVACYSGSIVVFDDR